MTDPDPHQQQAAEYVEEYYEEVISCYDTGLSTIVEGDNESMTSRITDSSYHLGLLLPPFVPVGLPSPTSAHYYHAQQQQQQQKLPVPDDISWTLQQQQQQQQPQQLNGSFKMLSLMDSSSNSLTLLSPTSLVSPISSSSQTKHRLRSSFPLLNLVMTPPLTPAATTTTTTTTTLTSVITGEEVIIEDDDEYTYVSCSDTDSILATSFSSLNYWTNEEEKLQQQLRQQLQQQQQQLQQQTKLLQETNNHSVQYLDKLSTMYNHSAIHNQNNNNNNNSNNNNNNNYMSMLSEKNTSSASTMPCLDFETTRRRLQRALESQLHNTQQNHQRRKGNTTTHGGLYHNKMEYLQRRLKYDLARKLCKEQLSKNIMIIATNHNNNNNHHHYNNDTTRKIYDVSSEEYPYTVAGYNNNNNTNYNNNNTSNVFMNVHVDAD